MPRPGPNSPHRLPLLRDKNPQDSTVSPARKESRPVNSHFAGHRKLSFPGPQRLRCQEAEQRKVVSELFLQAPPRKLLETGAVHAPQTSNTFNHVPGERPHGVICRDANPMTCSSHTALSVHLSDWASWWLMDTCPSHGQVTLLPKDT